MDFGLSDEERMILQTVREFVRKEVAPLLTEVQKAEIRGERFPDRQTARTLQANARTAGLWGLQTPEEYGGANLGSVLNALVGMETRPFTGDASTSVAAPTTSCSAATTSRSSATAADDRRRAPSCFALSEPNTGSDATNIQTRAVKDGGDWVLNGQKTWISSAHDGGLRHRLRRHRQRRNARGGITAFLVDRDMGWTEPPIPLMSSWAASEVWFDNVRVPDCNVLGEVGNGFELAMEWIGRGRLMIPRAPSARPSDCCELGLEYARSRKAFGQPIADYQAIQWMLADSAIEIEQVKWATLHAAWKADQGQRSAALRVDGQSLGRADGLARGGPHAAGPRRHGLHPRGADRARPARSARLSHLRGHRRNSEAQHRAQPPARLRASRRMGVRIVKCK